MKLSEIKVTKKEFLNTLKDPEVAKTRHKIKEFRNELKQWGWMITSRFDKIQRIFTIIVYIPFDKKNHIDKRRQVYNTMNKIWNPKLYWIEIGVDTSSNNFKFYLDTKPIKNLVGF